MTSEFFGVNSVIASAILEENSTDSRTLDTATSDRLINTFNTSIISVLDTHAPLAEIKLRRHRSPIWWSNSNLTSHRRSLRRLERRWRLTNLDIDRQSFIQQKRLYKKNLLDSKKHHSLMSFIFTKFSN
jgi:hypothetical protein